MSKSFRNGAHTKAICSELHSQVPSAKLKPKSNRYFKMPQCSTKLDNGKKIQVNGGGKSMIQTTSAKAKTLFVRVTEFKRTV